MNKFYKYAPNVWLAECDEEYKRGDIITLDTKYGSEVECEVYNLIQTKNDKYYYSIVRLDENYAERRAQKHRSAQARHERKAKEWHEKAQEGKAFLSLGEPIKIGHHSERRHRSLLERRWNRIGKSVKEADQAEERARLAEFWENKAKEITLANPESIEYFTYKLDKAKALHKGLKDGSIPRAHSYSLAYATKDVKELTQKVELAQKLWGQTMKTCYCRI